MAVLTVGSGQQFSTLNGAVLASRDGDTIYVQAGTYTNDFTAINTKVSIVGVGGMAHFVATVEPDNGKGILVTNTDVKIDHLEFSGAAVSDMNGAGIRYQNGTLSITNSYFHDNQEGILANSAASGVITIDRTEFGPNGTGDGLSHNIYIGQIATFQATNSYFHDAVVGHEIKSRAATNIITNNRVIDGNGSASYSIDLPNGGNSTIANNFIQQGPNSENPTVIAYGEENVAQWAGSQLLVQGNTIVNQLPGPVYGVWSNHVTAQITGNRFYGFSPTQIALGPNVQSGNDTLSSLPAIDTSHPWAASPWDRLISGASSADVLKGTAAKDLLVGGAGGDVFVAGLGRDTIADFSHAAGDRINLAAMPSIHSLADVLLRGTQIGEDASIDLGNGNGLTLQGVALSGLAASDFIFAGASSNSAPTGITLSQSSVAENSAKGTVIGALSAIDPDAGDTVSLLLVNNPGNLFAIQGGNLVVAGALDYETATSRAITIRATDAGGLSFDKSFTISVTDVPEVIIPASITLLGSPRSDVLNGGAGDDTLSGAGGNDTLYGQGGNDKLLGGAGNDVLYGHDGNDVLVGGTGIDTLMGGAGDDLLYGQDGNDTLDGGAGYDMMSGGAGGDRFVFTPADLGTRAALGQIADFRSSEGDKIDVSALDADSLAAGNQAFSFLGTGNFTGVAGQLHYAATGTGVIVSGDMSGDGIADFSIDLTGVTSLTSTGFLL